jgi:hypothetical protein
MRDEAAVYTIGGAHEDEHGFTEVLGGSCGNHGDDNSPSEIVASCGWQSGHRYRDWIKRNCIRKWG